MLVKEVSTKLFHLNISNNRIPQLCIHFYQKLVFFLCQDEFKISHKIDSNLYVDTTLY